MFCSACGIESQHNAKYCAHCGSSLLDPSPPEVAATTRLSEPFAGLWRRVAAGSIDAALLLLLAEITITITSAGSDVGQQNLVLFVVLPVFVLYFPVFEAFGWQGTLGKRALGIKVVAKDGTRLHFWRALMRNLAKLLTLLMLFPLGLLMSGFTARKQSLHDLVAGCIVVRRKTTTSDITAATLPKRAAGWWAALLVSATLSLLLPVAIVALSWDGYVVTNIRREMGLIQDEPMLYGKSARPVQ